MASLPDSGTINNGGLLIMREKATMKKSVSKLLHEGDYAVEVDVELVYSNDEMVLA